jgi:small subunit ribosomal protein S6
LRDYELLLVIRPNLDEAGATEAAKQIVELIQRRGGEVMATNVWGRRRLAYPIDNQIEATYVLLKFRVAPARLNELKFELKLNESLLRFMAVRDHQPQAVELQESASEEVSVEETSAENVQATEETAEEADLEVASTEEAAAVEEVVTTEEVAAAEETTTQEAASDEVVPETVS